MMIQSSSYGGMAIATLVADIQAIKNSFFRQNVVFVDQNDGYMWTKNGFLMACMSATNVVMSIPLQDDDSIIIRYIS